MSRKDADRTEADAAGGTSRTAFRVLFLALLIVSVAAVSAAVSSDV